MSSANRPRPTRIGILGAGRAGTALARKAATADPPIQVDIAASRPPAALKYHLAQYAPHAHGVRAEEIAQGEGLDLVILAVPQQDLDDVDPEIFRRPDGSGVVLVDATNRWEDEPLPSWLEAHLSEGLSSSEAIAAHVDAASTVVKSLNHISHWDVDAPRPTLGAEPRGIGVAGDDPQARALVAGLVEALGFTPVNLETLAAGRQLEPGQFIFNRPLSADQLRERLDSVSAD